MSQLVTVSKSSAEYKAYILGSFSNEMRAIPIETLNSVEKNDQVTFRLVPLKDIQRPNQLVIFLKMLRPKQFIFVLFPVFYLLLQEGFLSHIQDPYLVILSLVGIGSLFASIQLRNDFHEHMNGLDRLKLKDSSKPLLSGWITAAQLSQWTWFFVFFSGLCALPLIVVYPQLLIVLTISTLLLVWSLYRPMKSFRNLYAGELVFGILVGPLLSVGFQISVTGKASWSSFWFGVLWGLCVLFKMSLRNFENMAALSQAKIKNFANTLGFDQFKNWLLRFWLIVLAFYGLYHSIYFHMLVWGGSLGILAYFTLKFRAKLQKVESPLGSAMQDLQAEGDQLFLILVSLWMVQALFSYLATDFFGMLIRGI